MQFANLVKNAAITKIKFHHFLTVNSKFRNKHFIHVRRAAAKPPACCFEIDLSALGKGLFLHHPPEAEILSVQCAHNVHFLGQMCAVCDIMTIRNGFSDADFQVFLVVCIFLTVIAQVFLSSFQKCAEYLWELQRRSPWTKQQSVKESERKERN